jgi:hypothetical protein
MSDLVLLSLRRKLVQAESDGNDDRAKALKKRIREREKTAAQVEEFGEQNVADVLAGVGDDADLARAALDAENAKEKPRATLVAGLENVIAAAQEPEED